ncbi:hypothetical protein AB0387_13715 [Streptomyces sp. NPDC089173]|uniref:hypothetical protein n=1 Tax=Streptomyces sp. NPDC089173 TaxID=3154965 RepID=UPI00344C9F12
MSLSVRVRGRLARLTRALVRRRDECEAPFAELRRIESDPVYRALFLAELEAAIADREAEREAVLVEVAAAADRLRRLLRPERAT